MTHEFGEGVIVFDADGRLVFANEPALRAIGNNGDRKAKRAEVLLPRLLELGATITPLWSSGSKLGDLVLLGRAAPESTLAEQEREAILKALQRSGGRLAETARTLGVSRTTLWRRLRSYGVQARVLERRGLLAS